MFSNHLLSSTDEGSNQTSFICILVKRLTITGRIIVLQIIKLNTFTFSQCI